MGSYTVEQVEFLRQRADITYEEALEVLERCGGDLTRCLVDLERRGKIRKNGAAHAGTHTPRASAHAMHTAREGASLSQLLKKILRMRLVVTKESRTYVDLPIIYLALAAVCAPHLMIITVIAMFVMGLKIRLENSEGGKVGNDQFYDTVDKVADNIKSTVTSFARAAQENSEKARRADVEKNTPYQARETAEQDEPIIYAQAAPEAEEEAVDIPDVTPYEEFTGTESAPQKADAGEENEIIIG